MPRAPQYRIKVLEKALAVLDLFAEAVGELTLTQIGQRLQLSKATTFRIVNVLEGGDYLERVPGSQGYRLGLKLYRLGSIAESATAVQKLGRPYLHALAERSQETVHLTVLSKGEALYLDKIEGKHSVRVVSRVGMRLPAHCSGVGKVLLAHLDEQEVDRIVRDHGLRRFTPATITQRDALATELARIREQGYALDNEEIELGLKCVAAPVRDASGRVVAAISISGPKFRFDGPDQARFIALVLDGAQRISAALRDEARSPSPSRRPVDAPPVDEPVRKKRAARG